ncbi:RbsD/FucU domain-containing protein [Leifsonia sp. L25]|uniref:RbsD/FucU domain-containing protein n=1 Tax=Actinomycetes TaxID=1760 RepID=UPI003D68D2C0
MRRGALLHPGLASAFATLGHTDLVVVTDAGFPIPATANRIDLGITDGLVDVRDLLRLVLRFVDIERAEFAPELKSHHPTLYAEVQSIFTGSGAEFSPADHETLISDHVQRAKVVIRSGSFEPWANFALTASTQAFDWFDSDEVEILPAYVERRARIRDRVVPELP